MYGLWENEVARPTPYAYSAPPHPTLHSYRL